MPPLSRTGKGVDQNKRVDNITIREAKLDELRDVAGLRWDWVQEMGGEPAVGTREAFVSAFAEWASSHRSSHVCVVTLRGTTVIGMAWLAVIPRVPSPRSFERASGDLQSVYVVPRERNGKLGGRMIDAALKLAAERNLERVTVHSSARAIAAYERSGFAASPKLLVAELLD
jgi:GNAT superfamily N-acetyltransferase